MHAGETSTRRSNRTAPLLALAPDAIERARRGKP
jgi:hypothetical protein